MVEQSLEGSRKCWITVACTHGTGCIFLWNEFLYKKLGVSDLTLPAFASGIVAVDSWAEKLLAGVENCLERVRNR